MLPSTPETGLNLMSMMAASALGRACAQLGGQVRLTCCEHFKLRRDVRDEGIAIENWIVAEDRRVITVSVFATASQEGGGQRMAGAGRFTFTPADRMGEPVRSGTL